MKKGLKTLTIAVILAVAAVTAVYALVSITFYQTLYVPKGSIKVEAWNGTDWVEIQDGDNASEYWRWFNDTNSFNLTIKVTNIGESIVDIDITTSGLEGTGWTFTYVGDTENISQGDWREYKLSVHNPYAESGDTVSFSVTVSVRDD